MINPVDEVDEEEEEAREALPDIISQLTDAETKAQRRKTQFIDIR